MTPDEKEKLAVLLAVIATAVTKGRQVGEITVGCSGALADGLSSLAKEFAIYQKMVDYTVRISCSPDPAVSVVALASQVGLDWEEYFLKP